jgi:hypothetical protein
MSKLGKGLAGFGSVASTSSSKENTNEITKIPSIVQKGPAVNKAENDTVEEHTSELSNSVGEILHSVTKKPKPALKRQISAYIDEDVAKKLDKFGKEHGKGAKSELINNFLKSVLK